MSPTNFTQINSDAVAVIVGFTELGVDGRLYNAAAVLHRGACVGIYRKLHPAIRRMNLRRGYRAASVPAAITDVRHRHLQRLQLRRAGARDGWQGRFSPVHPEQNQVPLGRTMDGLTDGARACDVARATENGVWVVRADVTGRSVSHVSAGASGIVDPRGSVVASASAFTDETLTVDLERPPRKVARVRGD